MSRWNRSDTADEVPLLDGSDHVAPRHHARAVEASVSTDPHATRPGTICRGTDGRVGHEPRGGTLGTADSVRPRETSGRRACHVFVQEVEYVFPGVCGRFVGVYCSAAPTRCGPDIGRGVWRFE